MPCNSAAGPPVPDRDSRTLSLLRVEELGLVDLEQRGGGVGALKIAAEADELPALAVDHAGVGGAFEEIDAVDDRGELVVDVGGELRLRVRQMHLMVETVEALPHLSGDFFAHLAGVLARPIEAVNDRGGAETVVDQLLRHCLDAAVPLHFRRACRARPPCAASAPLRWSRRYRASGSWSRRAGARYSPPAPGSGSSSRGCRQRAIASSYSPGGCGFPPFPR